MVNINQLMQKLDEQLDTIKEVKDATGVSKKLAAIDKVTDDKFGELGKLALANALAEVGKAILTSRGQSGPRRKTTYKSVPLSGDARASLAERGVVTFPGANVLIRHTISQDTRLDLEKLISDHSRIVVSKLDLSKDDLLLECPDDFTGPVEIDIVFRREFVIRDSKDRSKYYKFRIDESEESIKYESKIDNLA